MKQTINEELSGSPRITAAKLRSVLHRLSPPFLTGAMFGVVGDGVADDTAAIQAAIDEAANGGHGTVNLGPGAFKVTGLKLRTGVILQGVGDEDNPATTLKLADGANADVIGLYDDNTRACGVKNLWVNGSRGKNTAGSGINFTSGFYSPHDFEMQNMCVSHVTVSHCAEHGIVLAGTVGVHINSKVKDANVRRNGGRGVSLVSVTDSSFSGIVSDANGAAGIHAEWCSNDRFWDCKTYYNGTSYSSDYPMGWYLFQLKRSMLMGCEAQEDWRYGFWLEKCQDITGTIQADANGREATPGVGVHIADSKRLNLSVASMSFHDAAWQGVGVEVEDCAATSLSITNEDEKVETGLSVTGAAIAATVNGVRP